MLHPAARRTHGESASPASHDKQLLLLSIVPRVALQAVTVSNSMFLCNQCACRTFCETSQMSKIACSILLNTIVQLNSLRVRKRQRDGRLAVLMGNRLRSRALGPNSHGVCSQCRTRTMPYLRQGRLPKTRKMRNTQNTVQNTADSHTRGFVRRVRVRKTSSETAEIETFANHSNKK